MIRALVVTHADLGEALVHAVEHFLGPQAGVGVVSNTGRSAAELRALIDAEISTLDPAHEPGLFSDLAGGSCEAACRAATRARGRHWSISGVNLPMLLEFCHYRDRMAGEDLARRVIMKGRASIDEASRKDGDACP